MFQGGAAPEVRVETDPEKRARLTVVELENQRERAEAETAELRAAETAGIERITQERENTARIALGIAAAQDEAAPAGTVGENSFASVNELAGAVLDAATAALEDVSQTADEALATVAATLRGLPLRVQQERGKDGPVLLLSLGIEGFERRVATRKAGKARSPAQIQKSVASALSRMASANALEKAAAAQSGRVEELQGGLAETQRRIEESEWTEERQDALDSARSELNQLTGSPDPYAETMTVPSEPDPEVPDGTPEPEVELVEMDTRDGSQRVVGERSLYTDSARAALQERAARTAAESKGGKKLMLRFVDPETGEQTMMLDVPGTWTEPEGSEDIAYSTRHANGFNAAYMLDRRVLEQAAAIVRLIFPGVQGVQFASALYGEGPALRRSQRAAGQRETDAAEVAGKVDRAAAIVTISLDGKFDPLETAYHEAYHLARQNLSEQERGALERSFPTEEDEAAAFAERATSKALPSNAGAVGKIFAKIQLLFERLGNMLRGLGFRAARDVFDAVLVGEVGRREVEAARHADVMDVVYSTHQGRPRDEYVAGVLNRKLNPEIAPEAEEEVEGKRRAAGYDTPGTGLTLEEIQEAAQEYIARAEAFVTATSVPKGEYAALAQGLRVLTQRAMVTLGEVAADVKAFPDNPELLAKLEKAYHLFTTVYAKSSMHASEIGLALRSYGEPVGKLAANRIDEYDAALRELEKGKTPELRMPAMDPDNPGKPGEPVGRSWNWAVNTAQNKHVKPDELRDFLRALRADEMRSLTDLYGSNPKQFRKLLDAFIQMGRLGLNNTTKQALRKARSSNLRNWMLWTFYNLWLSNPVSQARNIFGGAFMFYFWRPLKIAGTASIEAAGRKLFGWKRASHLHSSPEWSLLTIDSLFGAASDYGAAAKGFMNMWAWGKDTDPQGQFEEAYSEMDISALAGPNSFLSRPVWKLGVGSFWPLRIMAATDVFVRTLVARAELRLTAAKILAEPEARTAYRVDETAASARAWMDEFVATAPSIYVSMAQKEAREATFTQKLEGVARSFEQWRNRHVVGYALLPFVKIVMNQLSMGMRLIPGATLLSKDGRRALRTAGSERSTEYFRIVFGLGLGLLVYNLVRAGLLTGGGEEDSRRRNMWRMVRQPFSLLAGGRWHYISDLTEHLFYPIGILATIFEGLGWGTTSEAARLDAEKEAGMEEIVSKGLRVLLTVPDTAFNKSFLSNPGRLWRYGRDPNRNAGMLTEYMARLFTPAGWGFLTRLREESIYDAITPEDALRRAAGTGQGKIPPRLDVFGDALTKQPVAEVPWLGTLHSGRQTPAPLDGPVGAGQAGPQWQGLRGGAWQWSQPVDGPEYEKRKRQIATELTKIGYGFSTLPRSVAGIRLEPWERHRLGQVRGWIRYLALEALLSSPRYWEQESAPLKARLVSETLNRASITARQFIGMEYAAGNARLRDAYVELHGPENFGVRPLRRGTALGD